MKAVLTGHTRGLGAAIAEELLLRNIPVLGLARQTNDILDARYPDLLDQVQVDLGDSAALANWLASDRLRSFLAGEREVLLVNNAAILHPAGPAATQDVGAIARAVALNVAAPLMLSAAVAAARGGELRVLHVSSGAGRNPYAGWSVYCASKALDQHARAVQLDGDPKVRICSLAPGVLDTDMQCEVRQLPVERFPEVERFTGLKRKGQLTSPDEAAVRLVTYLLGDAFGKTVIADLRKLS